MFTTVAQLDDVPEGSLFGLESEDGQEIVLANVEGTIYALQNIAVMRQHLYPKEH